MPVGDMLEIADRAAGRVCARREWHLFDDARQAALERILRDAPTRPEDAYIIARSAARDELRRYSRHTPQLDVIHEHAEPDASGAIDALVDIEAAIAWQSPTPTELRALELVIEGHTIAEAAAIVEVDPSTVYRRVRRVTTHFLSTGICRDLQ